jgi:hypothetical protein
MKKLILALLAAMTLSCLSLPSVSESKPLFKIEYLSENNIIQTIFIPGNSNRIAVISKGPAFCYDWYNNEAIFETPGSFFDPTCIYASPDGKLLGIGKDGSVSVVDGETGIVIKDHGMAFGSKTYWIGFTDEDPTRLIGTHRGTAVILKPKGLMRDLTITLDPMNYVYSGAVKDRKIYFGQRGTIQVYNLETQTLEQPYTLPKNDSVTGVFAAKDGSLLAVCANEIFTIDQSTKEIKSIVKIPTITGPLLKVFPAVSDGEIYVVTQQAIYVYDMAGTVKKNIRMKHVMTHADISGDFRYISVTTSKGFYIYNLRDLLM